MLATFGMRQPRDMYPRFLGAHGRISASGVLTAELRCNHAHGLHIFERRIADAEGEFLATLEENPALASTYVRLARMYASCGRSDEALDVLARGHKADPLLPTVPAMAMLIRFWRREFDAAIALAQQTIELHPYVQVVRATYGQALEFCGRLDEALAQYQAASAISPDLTWLRALEGTCLARQQRDAEAIAILEELNGSGRPDTSTPASWRSFVTRWVIARRHSASWRARAMKTPRGCTRSMSIRRWTASETIRALLSCAARSFNTPFVPNQRNSIHPRISRTTRILEKRGATKPSRSLS